MDGLVYFLRDIFVMLFENVMEPLGNFPNLLFLIGLFVGLFVWLGMQKKFNAQAEADPNQIQ